MLATPTGDGASSAGSSSAAGSAARSSHTSTRSSRLASLNTGWMTLTLGAGQAAVRRDGLDRAVERVVAGAALEGLGLELRVQQPVGDGRVVADQAPRAAQQVALEVVGLDRVAVGIEPRVGGDAGGIEVPVDAGAQVERFGSLAMPFAVLDPVDQDVAVQRARVGLRLSCRARSVPPGGAARRRWCVKLWPRLSQARIGLPATSFSIQRAPASMLSWWMRLPSMS